MSEKGQSLIESAIAMPIAIIGITSFFALIWNLSISLIAHHTLYEMLICNELFPPPRDCRQLAKTKIQQVLLFGQLETIEYQRDSSQSLATAKVKMPFHLHLDLKESLTLPLSSVSP